LALYQRKAAPTPKRSHLCHLLVKVFSVDVLATSVRYLVSVAIGLVQQPQGL
jgi:hypothetical protein